jgi:CRISPR-associated protein (TIGR03986 family)
MTKFYSPYQFIPVTGTINGQATPTLDFTEIRSGGTHVRHDRWQRDHLSGRLICRLRTINPVLVGAEQTDGAEGEKGTIKPYYRDGRPAIPGNSLRGMIGAITEAISQSALRVLPDQDYSIRMTMEQSLKAIGLLRLDASGQWTLVPLALTSIQLERQPKSQGSRAAWAPPRIDPDFADKWSAIFGPDCPLTDCLAQYVGNYSRNALPRPLPVDCYQARHNRDFRELSETDWLREALLDGALEIPDNTLKIKGRIAYRQAITRIPDQRAENTPSATRGVLYILGHHGLDLMPNKRHEWFVPFPEYALDPNRRRTLTVPTEVLNDFLRLAKERRDADARFPLLPKGYDDRSPKIPLGKDGALLQDGDLVYFDTDGQRITQVSFSALWRRVVRGTLHGAFTNAAGPLGKDIVPWNRERHGLTPAECLFGVTEDRGPQNKTSGVQRPARNLASRVRFSDATALPGGLDRDAARLLPAVDLRIQSSPKPPSPAMYFHQPNGWGSEKGNLNLENDLPNGRKVYLHRREAELNAEPKPWTTTHSANTKEEYVQLGGRSCTPIAEQQDFYFHIDFDNLSSAELELLHTALVSDKDALGLHGQFFHKLGWGKPLGLGSVRIDILGISLVDRPSRYTADDILGGADSGSVRCFTGGASWPEALQERYARDYAGIRASKTASAPNRDTGLIDTETLAIVMTAGNPSELQHPVSYPVSTIDGQKIGGEGEGFHWFVHNEVDLWARESLGSIRKFKSNLPYLLPELHDHQGFITVHDLDPNANDKELRLQVKMLLSAFGGDKVNVHKIQIVRHESKATFAMLRLRPFIAEKAIRNQVSGVSYSTKEDAEALKEQIKRASDRRPRH